MTNLSVIIPSRTEKFLNNTIRDVLANATGEIEVIVVLDGYDTPLIDDPRLRYLRLPKIKETQKRQGINQAVEMAQGKYIMSLDAHCMIAKGFDEQLIKDHQPNWVQIPRRHRLDAENWSIQKQIDNRPPIDYEYMMFPFNYHRMGSYPALHGFKWDARTKERMDIPIDETMTFQGSCWFMEKEWFKKNGFMQIEGYSGWGQESEELGLTTWKNGGKVMTNKNTWYAHLHKGPKHGRMYWMSKDWIKQCNQYSYDFWVNKNKDFFISYIEKWWPVPAWPDDWNQQLYA